MSVPKVRLQHNLASVEKRYSDDLMAAKAMISAPLPIHDEPEMIAVAGVKEKKEKDVKEDEAVVLRSGPITLTSTGDVGGVPPGVAPTGSASSSSNSPAGAIVVGGVAPASADRKRSYNIDRDACTGVPFPSIGDFGIKLFTSMAEEHLLAAYIDMFGNVNPHIVVEYVEASDPIMWLARCRDSVPPEKIMLVPWASPLTRIVKDTKADPDGVLLQSIKRPKHLFAGLPLVATVEAACPDISESVVLAARSPLGGKMSYNTAPAAFWCAMEADEGDDGRANMEMRLFTMEFKSATLIIDGQPKKRRRDPKLQVTFPILVNTKPLKAGDTLVFRRGTKFTATPAEGEAVASTAK